VSPCAAGTRWGETEVETFADKKVKYNYKRRTSRGLNDIVSYFDVIIYEDIEIKDNYRFKDCQGNEMNIIDGSIIKLCDHKVRFNAVTS
jgi:hypothetical protein